MNAEWSEGDPEKAGNPPISPRTERRTRRCQHDTRWNRLRVGEVDLTADGQPGFRDPAAERAGDPPRYVVGMDSDRVSTLRTAKQEGVSVGAGRGLSVHDESLVALGGVSAGPEFPAEPSTRRIRCQDDIRGFLRRISLFSRGSALFCCQEDSGDRYSFGFVGRRLGR